MTKSRHPTKQERIHCRSIWLSDVHLGTAGCKAEQLTEFLDAHSCDSLYLVGDIIDGWKLKNHFFWPQEHTNVIRKILGQSRHGTQVYWVTGNHDEFLRSFVDDALSLGNIHIVNEVVHQTVDQRRFLILHGDIFDMVIRYHKGGALLSRLGYRALRRATRYVNRARTRLGYSYWSLSRFARSHVKQASNVVADYEQAAARECRRRGFDGIVCGHIHQPAIRDLHGVRYHNCGDWVDSCSALLEKQDGSIELFYWQEDSADTSQPLSLVT